MENPYSRVWAPIDLDAVEFNMQSMRDRIPAETKMAGVIKTDAYGHGAVPVARTIDRFASFFCVASGEEALNLRLHGIGKPILILGPYPGQDYGPLLEQGIRPTVFTMAQALGVSDAALRLGTTAPVHIALDTGMHRIGMAPTEENADLVKLIADLPGVEIEGLFTHLYRADEADLTTARGQVEKYRQFEKYLADRGVFPKIRHVSNSAGIMEYLGTDFDMVRCGITLYGIYPSDEVDRTKLAIRPVMSLKATVTYVKRIAPGDEVSYGGTFRAEKSMRVATIPVGYGDGYPRLLSNQGYVLINGRKARILGRVCMDQFMVDVTGIPDVTEGTIATLLGKDGNAEITVDELSAICGRFPYEFVCDIGKRVPRVYYKNGEIIGTKDWFHDLYEMFR